MGLAWALDSRAAPEPTDTMKFELRIAKQPLDEALQELARQSGVQVIYLSSLTEGMQSPGVSGKYTLAEALNKLLAGSGLTFRMINARAVQIRKAAGPPP